MNVGFPDLLKETVDVDFTLQGGRANCLSQKLWILYGHGIISGSQMDLLG